VSWKKVLLFALLSGSDSFGDGYPKRQCPGSERRSTLDVSRFQTSGLMPET
jgi:hypothetical protein